MCRCPSCSSSLAETWHTHFPRGDLAAREAAAWKAAQHQHLATLIPYLPELRGGKQQHFSDLLGFGWEKSGAQLPTVQEVCVVGYGGEGFYPRPSESLSFSCNGREGQKFVLSITVLLSLLEPHPGVRGKNSAGMIARVAVARDQANFSSG